MGDKRIDKANELIAFFRKHPSVQRTFLRGSLSKGNHDEYSDIDIGIDVSGSDNGEFAKELPSLIQSNFNILFYDWSPSLLPNEYVISFVQKDFPVFWLIDIQVMATPHIPSLIEVPVNKYHHLLKLWILNLKYFLRGNEEAEFNIVKLAKRTLNKEIENNNILYLMSQIIKEIKVNIEPELHDFIEKCEVELNKYI
ncbi:nucleotidyltransferase domain-containing protein [Ornithinibacillus sp. JPR2-1]|uniref:nucleotidyltransferase domain-containing protein n=1 Tax=Ornithinibacillus sp. JPR2-1 TaxID=2094019 RepID=UPI0031D6C2BF